MSVNFKALKERVFFDLSSKFCTFLSKETNMTTLKNLRILCMLLVIFSRFFHKNISGTK